MSDQNEKTPGKKKKDVDALLTEVTGVRKAPKAAAKSADAPKKEAPKKAAAAPAVSAVPKMIRIRQIKSGICAPIDQKQTLFGLGLRKIRQEVVRKDNSSTRGQILKIRHLVEVVGE
jgi:ribosomal protein L30